MSFRDQLNSYIHQLEKRLRLGAMLRGAAILTSVALAATVILVLITNALAFSRWSVTSARVVLLFALVLAVTFGIALPLVALNRRRAARRAEEMYPEFQQRLVTFAERDAQKREPFLDLLALDTLNVARGAEPKSLVPDKQLATFLGVGAVSLAILVWLILAGPGFFGEGAALLWAATPHSGTAPFYDIQVVPGDITVRRNADQMVTAQLDRPEARQNVRLYARYQSASKWDQVAMQPQAGGFGLSVRLWRPAGKRRVLRRGRSARLEALQRPRARPAQRQERPRDLPLSVLDAPAKCDRGARRRPARRGRHRRRPGSSNRQALARRPAGAR